MQDRIAAGGMATVHIGRLRGAAGFSRTVAIKRLLPHFACNPVFQSLFVHEAGLVARIQHPNVVATLDVVADDSELILVMDYVPGETLSRLMQAVVSGSGRVPQRIALAIMRDALCGLHAAHEARDRRGLPLDIVHRDISPQNLMVGSDGVTRVLDFGVAKAATSVEVTREGLVRGKAAYMAPEQLLGARVTRCADIYAVGVVLWEVLVHARLFPGGVRPELSVGGDCRIPSPRARGAPIDEALDAIVMRALAREPSERFDTAQQMMEQLTSRFPMASREEVADWVEASAGAELRTRAALVARVESADASIPPPQSTERRSSMGPGHLAPGVALATPHGQAAKRSSAFQWTALIATVLGGVVGVASAMWGSPFSFSAAKPEPSVIEPGPGAQRSPAAPSSSPLQKAERPLEPVQSQRRPAPGVEAQLPTGASDVTQAGCKPPYTIDAAGRSRYKPDCL